MQINTVDSIKQIKKFCCENFTDKNPFISYEFFELLENTHCTVNAKGWIPEHIIITNNDNIFLYCVVRQNRYPAATITTLFTAVWIM